MNFFEISQRMENGKQTYEYFVKRKKVCQKAWLKSHGISNGRYSYIAVEPFVCNKAGNLTALTVTDLCINCLMLVGNLLKWHKVYTLFPQQTKNVAVSRKRVDLLSVFCQYYSHSDPSQLLQLDLVLILLNNWLGSHVQIVWFSIVLGFTNGRTTGPSSDSAAISMPEKAWHLNPGVLSRQNSGLEKW